MTQKMLDRKQQVKSYEVYKDKFIQIEPEEVAKAVPEATSSWRCLKAFSLSRRHPSHRPAPRTADSLHRQGYDQILPRNPV